MSLVKKLLLALLVIVAVSGFWLWQQYQAFLTEPVTIDTDIVYHVEPGSSLMKISNDLYTNGITNKNPYWLYGYARYKNKAHLIKAGEFSITTGTTLPELLEQFIEGKVVQYPFTIVEGMTAQQLIDMVANDDRFIKTLTNYDLAAVMTELGFPDNHGEGEFAPETYHFSSGTRDIDILKRAHDLMTRTLEQAWQQKAEKLPYKTPYQALIMASIIEKETGIAEERPEIAGVFVRRLQKGMRLQTDPTVIYGMGSNYNGNIRRKDLRTDTPYNTYTRSGLPPTPIALPSKAAIEAALHPADGKSLYFVAMGQEGRHVFSNTLTEHNRAVRKYQLKK